MQGSFQLREVMLQPREVVVRSDSSSSETVACSDGQSLGQWRWSGWGFSFLTSSFPHSQLALQQALLKCSCSHVHHEFNHGQEQEAEAQVGGVGWKHPVDSGCLCYLCGLLWGAGTAGTPWQGSVMYELPVPGSWK